MIANAMRRWVWRGFAFMLLGIVGGRGLAEDAKPTGPAEAAARMKGPEGFRVQLFASEPEVRQPIGMTTDARGRLWVVENHTYDDAKVNFDLTKHDRILILEDADHDGRAEKRTVFWDQAQKATSVELGFGGVWVLAAPRLLFLPDRNGDDVPDGEPSVVLDGWEADAIRHNIVNGLRWGPDGWLYGRHGIQATSFVGPPGAPPDQRVALNCSIWRYHPTRQVFEVVCRGGTNSWGHDWDEHGELFFINTVIGHLWHGVPGAHFERMYGEDFNPNLYRLIPQTADHFHWDTAEKWSDIRQTGVTATTDQAGGGHAHSGLMIYQGDNWPDSARGKLYTINLHGMRVNSDVLVRRGAGYVGTHGADLLKTDDPWYRAIDLISGNDGGVFIADWSDVGECHENDGVDRRSGRIYKVTHGEARRPDRADVARLDDDALVKLQTHRNDWYSRQARHELQQRFAAGKPMAAVHKAARELLETRSENVVKLRALWTLYVTGGTQSSELIGLLDHSDEHVRTWAVRLLVDSGAPSAEVVAAFAAKAKTERSGLVLLYLASALQRLPNAQRWELAQALVNQEEFASDRVLPLMIWYGIEAAVPEAPERALKLAGARPSELLPRFIARRLTQDLAKQAGPVGELVNLLGAADTPSATRSALLTGMADALRGWRKAPVPPNWERVFPALSRSSNEPVRRVARELAVVFGSGRAQDALKALLANNGEETESRRRALQVLAEARAEGLRPLILKLLGDRDLGADAVRALAVSNDADAARVLAARFGGMSKGARVEAVVTLASRPASALVLLDAVEKRQIPREDVPAFQLRQMQGLGDPAIPERIGKLWPELHALSESTKTRIATLKAQLTPEALKAADPGNGRRLYARTCASCHVLFGEGGKIGPDITGSQRANLDYLLENLIDPSATVAADYRMSTVVLNDGRILNGIVGAGASEATMSVQTPTERLIVSRADVEESRTTALSLMPEGQLDVLTRDQVRDLIAYLMSPVQTPLP